jgi:hypothetical protein
MSFLSKKNLVLMATIGLVLIPCVASNAFAENNLPIDHNEPVDRRIIERTALTGLDQRELKAKRAEAAAMVSWFEAKQRIYKSELAQHLIEMRFNKMNLERLNIAGGSVAEIRLLEVQKRVEMDVFDTEQLQAYVDMSAADIVAAKARLEFLGGE